MWAFARWSAPATATGSPEPCRRVLERRTTGLLATCLNCLITFASTRRKKAAQTWFEHLGRGGTTGTPTVADACTRYVRHLRATKTERAANDAEARFKNYVLNHAKLAAIELPKLTPTQLEGWRKSLRELPTRSGGRRDQR